MTLHELICPTCDQRCLTDAAYTTCVRCRTFFYAAQQRTPSAPPVIPEIEHTFYKIPVYCAQATGIYS